MEHAGRPDRQEQILSAVIAILGRDGLAGVSVRAVAREAGVAHGLVAYYFNDMDGLIEAALKRVETDDLALLDPDPSLPPREQVCGVLHSIMRPEFLTTDYLSLRLQLWALAAANGEFGRINATAQRRYRERLARLIEAAVPGLASAEAKRRAADIDIIQNGIWLTALLRIDRASLSRAIQRCEEIAFAGA
ncbi:MAG: hypothetical protein RL347_340 [Actinomycetota bacterium]|jgi:AcrR family transcriptional regulator